MDLSPAMLGIARQKLIELGAEGLRLAVADHRSLPLKNHSFDLVISGWSICYLVDWYPQSWREELDQAFAEISRVTRPSGRVILLETQGTGFNSPNPPPHLTGYFDYLHESGFDFSWIRTDYQFADLEEAVTITRFFFGEELAERVKDNNWVVLPECTGFWTKKLS